MKALLIMVSLLTLTISLEAQYYFDQWYFRKCQVTSLNKCTPGEFDCLWTSAYRLNKTGKILTIVGTASAVLPILIGGPTESMIAMFSIITIPVGGFLDIIGIPCLVTGHHRINQLKNTPYYKSKNFGEWYFKKCQVSDLTDCTPEEFECLWTEATKLRTTGIVFTVVGTTIATVAGVVLATDPWSWTEWPYSYAWWLFGIYGIPTGVLLDLIGIPCIVKGHHRIDQLMNTPHHGSQHGVAWNLNPTLLRNPINNTYTMGLTASIRF